MIRFLLIIWFFSVQNQVFGQKLEYDIVKSGKTIGSVVAEKKLIGDTVVITITSEAKFKLLLSFNVSYILEEKFVNGSLVSGKAENYLNGNIQKSSVVYKQDDKYVVLLNGEKTEFDLRNITYSITNLYFKQPPNLDFTIFSQQFADFLPIYWKKAGQHELESDNGNNNYYYSNGTLKKVKVSRSYATFFFMLKE